MFKDHDGFIWMDGTLLPWKEAKTHILTHTLHYGSGVFEGERAYDGKIFEMTRHHQRLHDSAAMLGFKISYSVQKINDAAIKVLCANGLLNAYVRPIAFHGAESLGVGSSHNRVHLAIAAWEWNSYFDTETGIKLMWSKWRRPAPNMAPVHAKACGQYITGTLSRNEAEKEGFHDAIMKDPYGFVAECTGANIFYAKNGKLYTPEAECFLEGITRETVLTLARQEGIQTQIKRVLPEELMQADEVFLTGTAVEIQPVAQIEKTTFETGPLTRHIAALYKKLVLS